MPFFVKRRDSALGDIPDEVLRQLTGLLYLDSANYFGYRALGWLSKQERLVKGLDTTLLRPTGLFARFVLFMRRTSFPFRSLEPNLCQAHEALDPAIIRNMLQLVADECTLQTDRYRSLRLKKKLSPLLEEWLDRVDSVTALWLGEDRFQRVFGCRLRGKMPDCVVSKCEACMLSVVGGSATHLTDLRASVLARQVYNVQFAAREHKTSRLLRIVNSWISFFREDCRKAICERSEALVQDIVEMRTLAKERRNKRIERRRRKGKPPRVRKNVRVRLTKEGLPIPRQPRLRRGDRERLTRKIERRMETVLSLQETVVERQEQDLEAFCQSVSDKAHDPMRAGPPNCCAQQRDCGSEITTEGEPERTKQSHPWDNWLLENYTCEEDDDDEEGWEQNNCQPIPDAAPRQDMDLQQRSLGFDATTLCRLSTATASIWTSEVEESPLLVQASHALSFERTASSSVYSCDERIRSKTTATMLEEMLSIISRFKRTSTASASLQRDEDIRRTEMERDRGDKRRTWLAMLEGRYEEDDAASCYETMGWGGPKM